MMSAGERVVESRAKAEREGSAEREAGRTEAARWIGNSIRGDSHGFLQVSICNWETETGRFRATGGRGYQ